MKYGMIPFFIPHVGCPHVCTFCNQSRITETSGIGHLTSAYITSTIEAYTSCNNTERLWEVCFYGGSFSAIPKMLQEQLLQPAWKAFQQGVIDGIRCSTRPDAVGDDALMLLQRYGVSTVELGVQSMNDDVLRLAKRGHTSDDVRHAVVQLRKFNMTVGLQILPGLLGDSWHTILETAVEIVKLKPDFVRIYPVLVIDQTELAEQYKSGLYTPLTTEQAVTYCAFLKTWFENHHIKVIRTGLQSTEELDKGSSLLSGPYEPAMGELVANEQWRQRIIRCIDEHRNTDYVDHLHEGPYMVSGNHHSARVLTYNRAGNCDIHRDKVHISIMYPRSLASKVRGVKNRNINYFNNAYESITFTWAENNDSKRPICCIDGVKYML